MRQTRNALNTNAIAAVLRAVAESTPVSPGCIAAFSGALPTGQSAAAKNPPVRHLRACAPAGDDRFGNRLCSAATLQSA